MISGEYKNSLDEKGRILIPSKIRNAIDGNVLILTRGVDQCLWLFPPEEWGRISSLVMDSTSIFKSKTRLLQRRIVAPAQECEIDKAGRINIPPSLRESAGLIRDAVILGIENYIEIWDEAAYNSYLDESEEDFLAAAEELGDLLST
ncbi:MAG: division/cell wall cluster transcriptional repressor MraZ [Spirochaetales bacterium]|nr:division/cell wall cluster transcriptional repressor MraZ [Spirochaetales bacterium]